MLSPEEIFRGSRSKIVAVFSDDRVLLIDWSEVLTTRLVISVVSVVIQII